jgi:hypothetical protein
MEKNARLSAPEAFVLMSLPKFDVRKALKLGFMGLLAQGVLRIEQEDRPGLIRTRHIAHLHVAPNPHGKLSPIASSLVELVRATEPDGLMKDVVKQSMRVYGKTLLGFVQNHVAPALIGRGLAEMRKSRLLGVLPLTRYYRTPAGDAEKSRLEGLMRDARSIPSYLDRDPAQAAALIAGLGGAIILVEELRPHYQAIASAMRERGNGVDGGGFIYDGGDAFGDGGAGTIHDGGFFDFSGVDFSAFDAGAFDSFDAGFSDAGGDGGGGDGGSSGC